MYRYVALRWNRSDRDVDTTANKISARFASDPMAWKHAYRSRGLEVFHTGEIDGRMQAYCLNAEDGQGGVVVGKLFEKPAFDDAPIASNAVLTTKASHSILTSEGQSLIDFYWGRYVAFANNTKTNTQWVIRDPIGGLSCFHTTYNGVDIFYSDLSAIAGLEFLDVSRDWTHIGIYLKYTYLAQSNTGCHNVSQLLPGFRMKFNQEQKVSSSLWDPCRISQTDIINDAATASRLLRTMTKNCVAAWAGNYKKILHRIGGLDSSIVLACLSEVENRPDIKCFTYYTTETSDGDERIYARMAAQRAGVELLEVERRTTNVDLDQLHSVPRTPIPDSYWYAIELGQKEIDLSDSTGAEATFTGAGGDQIFLAPIQNYGCSDYLYKHGLQPKMLKYAIEAAQIQDISLWAVIIKALRDRSSKESFNPFKNKYDAAFVNSNTINHAAIESVDFAETALHWLAKGTDLPRGKLLHIFVCDSTPVYHRPLIGERHIESVDPLMSQPLVELCFRIPSWILGKGGMKRGLARFAFADDVPLEIIRRESKSSAVSFYKTVYKNNTEFLKEFLLDGYLVKRGLLQREAVEESLTNIPSDAEYLRLTSHINLEAWLKSHDTNKMEKLKLA